MVVAGGMASSPFAAYAGRNVSSTVSPLCAGLGQLLSPHLALPLAIAEQQNDHLVIAQVNLRRDQYREEG